MNSDHERLPLTNDDNITNRKKCNNICKLNNLCCEILYRNFCEIIGLIITIVIVVIILYSVFNIKDDVKDIPISKKNYTIICDTWNGNNHPCEWNSKWCTIKNPCVMSCMDYIKFNAGCIDSKCNKRGRYNWCEDKPFGGQGGFLNYN